MKSIEKRQNMNERVTYISYRPLVRMVVFSRIRNFSHMSFILNQSHCLPNQQNVAVRIAFRLCTPHSENIGLAILTQECKWRKSGKVIYTLDALDQMIEFVST